MNRGVLGRVGILVELELVGVLVLELPEEVVDLHRGTSLVRKRNPPGTTIGPYERGTLVRVEGFTLSNSGCRAKGVGCSV